MIEPSIVGLIPARVGSKRVVKKNVRMLDCEYGEKLISSERVSLPIIDRKSFFEKRGIL